MKKVALLLLYLGIFSSVFAIESSQIDKSDDNKQTNKNYFSSNFNYPVFITRIFRDEIRVKINGSISGEDSLHFNSIIDTIQNIIKPQKIELVNSGANLIFYIDHPDYKGEVWSIHSLRNKQNKLMKRVVFNFYDIVDQEQRNKMITFYLIRSITDKHSVNPYMSISKSIFSEKDPLKSEFLKIDKLMVKWLCSGEFEKYMRACYTSYFKYLKAQRPKVFFGVVNVIAFIVAFLFFILFVYLRLLKLDAEKYLSFVSSGVLFVLCIYIFTQTKMLLFNLSYGVNLFSSVRSMLIQGIGALFIGTLFWSLVFFFEKLLFSLRESILFKFIVQLFSLVVVGAVGFVVFIFGFKKGIDLNVLMKNMILLASLGLIRALYNYQCYKTMQQILQKDVDLSRLSDLKSKAELNALHSRINPHFLYNSLNSIATLARISARKAEKMALALSDFCRFAINRNNETYTTVNDEVGIVKSYLEIEKIRFGDRLDYSIELDHGVENYKIPRFIIQPLIENAIKHGISKITGLGKVKLFICKVEDKVQIKVVDNGPDFPEHLLTGHGLQSIHDKLNILYKDLASMNWENGEHKYICITLPVLK